MFLEKSIIGVDMATDQSYARVKWKNDGTYTKDCIYAPIIDRRKNSDGKGTVCIGHIASVNDEYVYGLIWGRYLTNELLNNLHTSVSIEIIEMG